MGLILSKPQEIYLNSLNTKFRSYVGGFGSGKTYVGCLDLLIFGGRYPKSRQGYFGISYPSIRDIFFPTFEEAACNLGFTVDIKESNKEVHFYRSGFYYGTIICRSMDKPSSIVGFKIARALVDEIDVLPTDKAEQAWNKIIARLRLVIQGVENSIGVTTTPEGFRFVYSKFSDNPTKSYSMVQASTYENQEFLPDDYIASLIETYDEGLALAYIDGLFVNLTSGTVYRNFDRATCNSSEEIRDKEPLYIGQDFNVNNMASVVYVKRKSVWHAVAELTGGLDTPSTIDTINERWPDHEITIYPDASGKNRSSKGASTSDIAMLKQANFKVRAKAGNPRVKDRVLSVNTAFSKGLLKVNTRACPEYTKCLEQQAYDKNGEPDKTSGHDHQNDAGGYPVVYEMPVKKPAMKPLPMPGMI